AELPTVAAALDADLVIGSTRGKRTVRAADFAVSILTTVLEPDELVLEMRIPAAPANSGFAFLELTRQHGAFAIVSAAASVSLRDGRIDQARLCLGGVADTPIRATRAEAALAGQQPSENVLAEAARLAAEDADPTGAIHGS